LRPADSTRPQCRPRNNITRKCSIQIKQDAWVSRRVERGSKHPSGTRVSSSSPRDSQVEAEWVVLRSACRIGSMKGNNLVTYDIVAFLNRWWNGDAPGVVVGDHSISPPDSGVVTTDERGVVDFEPFEGCLVDGFAGSVAVGHVVCDGAFVR